SRTSGSSRARIAVMVPATDESVAAAWRVGAAASTSATVQARRIRVQCIVRPTGPGLDARVVPLGPRSIKRAMRPLLYRERIQWRANSAGDTQWGGREQEFPDAVC